MRRLVSVAVTGSLLVMLVLGAARPQPARAILGAGDIVSDPGVLAQQIISYVNEKLTTALKEAWLDAAATFWNNGVQQFINKLAQDSAMWVASGDKGQKPLFFTNNWNKYLQNSVEDAIASSAIAFGQKVGLGNICVSPQVAIDLILPQLSIPIGGKPRCSLDKIKKAWDVTDPAFLENFTLSFSTSQNDIGVAVNFLIGAQEDKAKAEEAAKKEREQSVFKPVKDFISDLTQTPAPLVETKVTQIDENTVRKELVFTGRPVADAVRVFVATLAGQYLNKLKSGFFSARDLLDEDSKDRLGQLSSLLDPTATGPAGGEKAKAQFVGLFKPDLKQANQYDIIQEFSTCTSEIKYDGIFNCVIDSGFVSALQAAGEDGYLTVQQAVQRGFLHGGWSFGFTDPGAGIEPSYLNGYSYSNMKKLRRARIVPVGWELAALKSRQLNQRITLDDALKGFTDTASPLYHLVDPDWVLKIPQQRCAAQAPGQILLPDSAERKVTCVDLQDCVAFGRDGECQSWGYCTNEKRAWAFPAQKCAEQFATCDQLVEPGQDTSDNLWLTKTLDYKGCNAESAGCTWYSLSKDAANEWIPNDRIYLNGQVKECDENDAGCRQYIRMVAGTNLLRNSGFEDDGGHNYVLGNGDQTADNGTPDGWSARSAKVALLQADTKEGANVVQLQSQATAGVCNPGLQYTAPISSFEVGQSYVLSGQVHTNKSDARDLRLSFQNLSFTVKAVSTGWTPFSFTFVMPATSNTYVLTLGSNNGACDALNTDASVFYDAVQLEKGDKATAYVAYGSTNKIHLKKAPSCSFEDVGCQTYKPSNDPSNPINGVVTGANLCPQECVGYDTYEKQATDTEPAQFDNFIPSTAKVCSAEQVGCEQFTNLDTVAKGGEGLEYYSSIRHCAVPQPQCGAYYAWEGSDVSGFQLVRYSLLANAADGSGAAKTTDGSSTCDPKDTNCRELIAADGGRAYRNMTKTITCSEACVPLRAGPSSLTQAQCEARLGEWETATNRCIFHVIPSESRVCEAAASGCREYVGNTGLNVAVIYNDTFESAALKDWTVGTQSTESTTVGGHSLKLPGAVGTIAASTQVVLPNVVAGKGYELELSAKSSVPDFITVTAWLGTGKTNPERLGAFVTGTKQWNQYKLGPIVIPANAQGPFKLFIDANGSSSRSEAMNIFIDNVTVRQIKSSSYLVRNSWKTPNTCDTNPPLSNGSASRTMLGCKQYTVQSDATATVNATGFARLCAKEKVGCEAVIDTANSDAAYREIFQANDQAEVTVPEDRVRYVINRKEFNCEEEQKGCMEVGKPNFDIENNISSYTTTYLVNDPNTYNTILCKEESLFCRAYQNTAGTVIYAKTPGVQQCEYRAVKGSFPPRNAWFKVGDKTEEENPDECLQAEKNSFVRRCQVEDVSCTQYVEPITKESYFYRKNTLHDSSQQCNGLVDWKNGCVLFDDISNRSKTFKSGDTVDYTGAPTGCQTNDVGCNTNILLRVSLDRVCSQWLAGVSTSRYYDRASSQYKGTSYSLGRCIEADPLNPTICRKWDNSENKTVLTEGVYKAREVSWAASDFSGYSIPNQYPVETLRQRSIGIDEDGNPSEFRLTHVSDPAGSCRTTSDCGQGQVCRLSLNPQTAAFQGFCYVEEGLDNNGSVAAPECRGYPEADSPFPSRLAQFASPQDEHSPNQIISKDAIFKNANIGEKSENVECSYHKAYYGGTSRYYGINSVPAEKIKVDDTETKFSRKDTFIGWQGYCLERDPSRQINGNEKENACLTWYPVDLIQGALDFNQNAQAAGYNAPTDRNYYCAEAMVAEYRTTQWFCKFCPDGYNMTSSSRSSTCSGGNHWRLCVPGQGDGWYAYDGLMPGETIGIMCSKVASVQSPAGTNRAWTTRVLGQKLPGSKLYFVQDLGWGVDQQNSPYGAARAVSPRLEDLSQPLIVRDPNTFTEVCDSCKTDEGKPYGICEDDKPDRKGKICPMAPNAGSPYAINSPFDPKQINNDVVKVRRDNRLPKDEPQPYPGSETYSKGYERLAQLFAKSYGVWQWQGIQNVCVGSCQGGLHDGDACESDASCGDADTTIVYTCKGDPAGRTAGTCVGGANNNRDCKADKDCQFARTQVLHQCVELNQTDPDAPKTFVCDGGPWAGQSCSDASDCVEDTADGVCSFESRCQAVDANGKFVTSANSGALCNSSAQCNAAGVCRVARCSTEAVGTNSGVCSGKKAGDQCGSTTGKSQYVRVPVGKPEVGWDILNTNPALAQAPLIRPTVADPSSTSGFQEGSITGFTINGSQNGTLAAQGGRAPVTASFYAYNENGEQMPLRVVMVDWGDGSDPAESRGSFKNHKHLCRQFCSNAVGKACKKNDECKTDAEPDAKCLPFNFGDSESACTDDSSTTNGFFTFSYTYTCEGPEACSYTPSVLVKDNWGATTRVAFPGRITVQPAPLPVTP